MSEPNEGKRFSRKEALKRLREARRDRIQEVARRVKEQKRSVDAIREALQDGGRTIPELAEQTGLESSIALWIVATLKKYGEVVEAEKDGSYFRYEALRAAVEPTAVASPSTEEG